MSAQPGVGGQNAFMGGGRTSTPNSEVPDVRPQATKEYYWQRLRECTSVESIRLSLLDHLKSFHVEAPDDLVRYLAYNYYSLLHAQALYDAWEPTEEMPTFGRRPVSNEIDSLYVSINKTWKELQASATLDSVAAKQAKDQESPLAGMMREPRKVVPLN